MAEDKEPNDARAAGLPLGIAMGMALGMLFGVALDNIALGLALGVAVGAGVGVSMEATRRSDRRTKDGDGSVPAADASSGKARNDMDSSDGGADGGGGD
ncbi:MAG: hypothetical protein ACK4Y4_00585 [Brevundimonas sp.]